MASCSMLANTQARTPINAQLMPHTLACKSRNWVKFVSTSAKRHRKSHSFTSAHVLALKLTHSSRRAGVTNKLTGAGN